VVTYNKHRWWCKGLLKCLDAGAKVKVLKKNHGILSLHKKGHKKYN